MINGREARAITSAVDIDDIEARIRAGDQLRPVILDAMAEAFTAGREYERENGQQ